MRQQESEASRIAIFVTAFLLGRAACEPGNWTGLWCFVEEVGEEVGEGEVRGKLDRWRTAPNNWDTAWLT